MKKEALFLLIFIFTITITSAAYTCSDSGTLLTDQEEITTNNRKSINGLGIGLISSDEIAAMRKITAELFINAKKISLTNETPSKDIELFDEEYTITLINSTETKAEIDVEGDSETIEKGEIEKVDDTKVLLINTQDSSLQGSSIDLMIATNQISLNNLANPNEIMTFEETEYLIELFSASDNDVVIMVRKCSTGNLIEIAETPPINTTEINTTNTSNPPVNTTPINITNQTPNTTNSSDKSNEEETLISTTLILILIAVIIIVIIALLFFLYFKKKPQTIQ